MATGSSLFPRRKMSPQERSSSSTSRRIRLSSGISQRQRPGTWSDCVDFWTRGGKGSSRLARHLPPAHARATHRAHMFFLTPKYLKKGRLYIKEAEKRLAYHRDRWSSETIITFESAIAKLRTAVKARNRDGIEASEAELEKLCGEHCPRTGDSWIGEH